MMGAKMQRAVAMGVRTMTTRHIRRRSATERRTLMLRRRAEGEDSTRYGSKDRVRDGGLSSSFFWLRLAAQQRGLEINQPACLFLSPDEMKLMAWICESQRPDHMQLRQQLDAAFLVDIVRCGEALTRVGIRLPSAIFTAGHAQWILSVQPGEGECI